MIEFLSLQYNFKVPSNKIIYRNVKGIGNYNTAPNQFKNRILRDNPNNSFYIFCCYDTDVFEGSYVRNPRVNWMDVEKRLKKYGAMDIFHIKAEHCIEDWFLLDKSGICKYLKIKVPQKLNGTNGIRKIQNLFKKGNKVYQKGFYVYKFLDNINFNILYSKVKNEFIPLVKILQDIS